jgi:hypothetical protein
MTVFSGRPNSSSVKANTNDDFDLALIFLCMFISFTSLYLSISPSDQ